MQWPLVTFKKFASLVASLSIGIYSTPSLSLDESRLWLPTSHNTLYLKLKEAALKAEQLDRCVTVLKGTIDREQSTKNHPIYRILCRQENRRSYNEMVDGLTMETLTTVVPVDMPPTEEELLRIAEEKEQRKRDSWSSCQDRLGEKVKFMAAVNWIGENEGVPTVYDDERIEFVADFDGENMEGVPLKYTAICKIRFPEDISIRIRKRVNK